MSTSVAARAANLLCHRRQFVDRIPGPCYAIATVTQDANGPRACASCCRVSTSGVLNHQKSFAGEISAMQYFKKSQRKVLIEAAFVFTVLLFSAVSHAADQPGDWARILEAAKRE